MATSAVAAEGSIEPSRPWIFGQVTERQDSPLMAATLTLTDLSGRQLDRKLSDSGGHYRLGPPGGGSYLVICASEAHQPTAALVAVAQVPVRHDVALATEGASLSGYGWPVPHVMVTVVDETGRQSGRGAVGRLDTGLAHEPSASTLRARPM